MSVVAHRVAARYRLARALLAPDIHKIEALIRQESYDDALKALDQFLSKKLQIRVTQDGWAVRTEWVHALGKRDLDTFETIVKFLSNLRYALQFDRDRYGPIWPTLERIKEELPLLEGMARTQEDEFKHGPFTIILTKGAEDGLEEALATLDVAADKIRRRFPKVLYGKVFVRRGLRGESGHQSGGQVAGVYVGATDTISLSLYAEPTRDSVMTLIHEFGHRYHTRFLPGEQREEFKELSEVGDVQRSHFPLAERRRIAAEWMALLREHQQERYPDPDTVLSARAQLWSNAYPRDEWRRDVVPLQKRFRDDKDESVAKALEYALGQYQYEGNLTMVLNEGQYSPLAASEYGKTHWMENFAECFLATVLGMPLPKPLKEFMNGL